MRRRMELALAAAAPAAVVIVGIHRGESWGWMSVRGVIAAGVGFLLGRLVFGMPADATGDEVAGNDEPKV